MLVFVAAALAALSLVGLDSFRNGRLIPQELHKAPDSGLNERIALLSPVERRSCEKLIFQESLVVAEQQCIYLCSLER